MRRDPRDDIAADATLSDVATQKLCRIRRNSPIRFGETPTENHFCWSSFITRVYFKNNMTYGRSDIN